MDKRRKRGRRDCAKLVESRAETEDKVDPWHWVYLSPTPPPHDNSRQGIGGGRRLIQFEPKAIWESL